MGMDSLGSYVITNSCELLQKYYDDSQRFLCVQTISTEGFGSRVLLLGAHSDAVGLRALGGWQCQRNVLILASLNPRTPDRKVSSQYLFPVGSTPQNHTISGLLLQEHPELGSNNCDSFLT